MPSSWARLLYIYEQYIICYTDVDECLMDNGNCDQLCNNTLGSFGCSCWPGFNLTITDSEVMASGNYSGTNNYKCLGKNVWISVLFKMFNVADINECDYDNGGCSHMCNNTAGSYQCHCYNGYKTNEKNLLDCKGIIY